MITFEDNKKVEYEEKRNPLVQLKEKDHSFSEDSFEELLERGVF